MPAQSTTRAADNRITLDVVAKDRSGKPVPGLQEQDFTVIDNKRPEKIVSFQAMGGAATANAPLEVVLVVDSVNTSFQRVAYERTELDKFLKRDDGRLAWPVSIAFLSDSGLNLQGTATRDGNALVGYLDQHVIALRSVTRSQGFYGAVDRLKISLDGVQQLTRAEATRPGRKIVIWLSPGWPILSGPNLQLTEKQEQQAFETIVTMSTLLRQSRITLDSVDPLGTADSGGLRTSFYQEFLKGVKSPRQAAFGDLALQVLATQSGGRVLNSNNDIAGEIETCIRDADAYYVLSFDGPPADGPNDYHAIEVKIAGHDLKAQTRAGYYAQP
jgi:VWFA-related protein